jgi:hypothetical protein
MNIEKKEVAFSLHNVENFKKEIDASTIEILYKLSLLLTEYLKFILENTNIKNTTYIKFVILRGMNTVIHVFRHLLWYTKNLDLTYFHCQKSFFFYVEFVGQILEDDKTFLQLTTRDATLYVYKKTIYEINNEIRKKNTMMNASNNKIFKKIDCVYNISSMMISKIMENIEIEIDKTKIEENIKLIERLLQENYFLNLNTEDMIILENIVDKMNTIFKNVEEFFDLNLILFKKIIKSTNYIHKIYEQIKLLDENENHDIHDEKHDSDNKVNKNKNKTNLVKEIIYSFIS